MFNSTPSMSSESCIMGEALIKKDLDTFVENQITKKTAILIKNVHKSLNASSFKLPGTPS